MKKIKFTFFLILNVISIIVISQDKSFTFCNEKNIKGTEILSTEYGIESIYVVDTFLLAIKKGNNFTLYSAKTFKKIIEFAKVGNGPGEFTIGFHYCGQYVNENNIIYIWGYDLNRNTLYSINVTESIDKNKTILDKKIKISPECGFFNAFFVDSTKIIGSSHNGNPKMNRLQIFNPIENKIVKTIPAFPEVKNDNNNINFLIYRYNQLFISSLQMKPDKMKFASAMQMFNRLDIFDNYGNLENSYIDDKNNITESVIEDFLLINQEHLDNVSTKFYYFGLSVSNSFIYALYYEQLQADFPEQSIPVKIRIFNWRAEPVFTINVPDYILFISVDEKNEILYGVDYYNEKILKYDISSILDEIKTGSK
jgi:hypothetical protein